MRDATDQMLTAVSDAVDEMAARIRELESENEDLKVQIADLNHQLIEATP